MYMWRMWVLGSQLCEYGNPYEWEAFRNHLCGMCGFVANGQDSLEKHLVTCETCKCNKCRKTHKGEHMQG